MDTVRSKDGTTIAFDKQGDGPALILVDGAMSTRSSGSNPELAKHLLVRCPRRCALTHDVGLQGRERSLGLGKTDRCERPSIPAE